MAVSSIGRVRKVDTGTHRGLGWVIAAVLLSPHADVVSITRTILPRSTRGFLRLPSRLNAARRYSNSQSAKSVLFVNRVESHTLPERR